MTIFPGKMSSDGDDWSLLAPSETNLEELSKRSRIRYTREFLVSLAELSIGKGLLKGIEPSVLSELDFLLEEPQQNFHESDSESLHDNLDDGLLQNSENDGLLGPGSLLGANEGAAGTSPPKVSQARVEDNSLSILHKCKEPYRPPHLFKTDWNDIKEKTRMPSPKLTSQKGDEQNWRRDVPVVMREGQKQDKPKNYSIDNHKNIEIVMPLEVSKIDEITNSLLPEYTDYTENHTKSPATCTSESAHQFPDIADYIFVKEKPACGLSCTKGSEYLAQGAPNEDVTKVPDQHWRSDADDTSEQSYGCQIPDFILGVLACVGLEHILKPGTTEITSSMLWEGSDAEDSMQHSADNHGAQQFHFLPEKGTEQNNTVEYSKPISSDMKELKYSSQGNVRELEKDPTQVPSCGASSRKEFQSVDASSCFRQSPVGRSTRKSVCKFFFPVVNMNPLPATSEKYKPSEIISEAGQSKGGINHSFSDELNPNPDSYFDGEDSLPLDICLPDEDSLITVDDFRIVTYKDMLEKNQAKADKINTSPPVNTSVKTADSNIRKIELGNTSYPYQQAQTNFPVNSIKPKFQPQMPSNRPYSTNMAPTTFHQPQAKPLYTETVPTCYMQQLYQVQAFPWTYQTSSYANVAVPTPALQTYGGNTLYGTQSNAGTGYYRNWQ